MLIKKTKMQIMKLNPYGILWGFKIRDWEVIGDIMSVKLKRSYHCRDDRILYEIKGEDLPLVKMATIIFCCRCVVSSIEVLGYLFVIGFVIMERA